LERWAILGSQNGEVPVGWLKDHVKEQEGEEVAFSELARRMLKSEEWPKGHHLKEDTLATYLGHFDKGEKPQLLQKHPWLRQFLADYLRLSVDELDERLAGRKPRQEQQNTRFPLWDIGTRSLDLRVVHLPPAFPPAVLDPRQWPVLWRAPSGSARTLVGSWLTVQKGVTFIRAETWEEAQPTLPQKGGALFVALNSASGLPKVDEVPRSLTVCIAVDGPLQPSSQTDPSGDGVMTLWSPFESFQTSTPRPLGTTQTERTWKVVRSPSVDQWLEKLVHWLAECRLSEVDFDPQACLEWLRRDILPSRLIDGFGAAVGFVGLYANYNRKLPRNRSLPELAQYFIRTRLRSKSEEFDAPEFKELWEYLQQLARALLTRSRHSWEQAQSTEEWCGLVRTGVASGALSWLSDPSNVQGMKLDARALRKRAESLPPESFLMIRALKQLRLLREQQHGMYVLRPRWVLATLLQQVADELVSTSSIAWGTALLNEYGAHLVLERLMERFRSGDFTPIKTLLSEQDLQSPAWVAALEGSFVALGLTLLHGGQDPHALAPAVFDLQQRLAVEDRSLPLPRIGYGRDAKPLFLRQGAWWLAAHVLSERLPALQGPAHPILNPWKGVDGEDKATEHALYEIWEWIFDDENNVETRLKALELYGRLFQKAGSIGRRDEIAHSLQMPEYVLTRVQEGNLEWRNLEAGSHREEFLPLLRTYVERAGCVWKSFAAGVWKAWLESPSRSWKLWAIDKPWAQDWWACIPPEAIQDRDLKSFLNNEGIPYGLFSNEQWDAFLTSWKQSQGPSIFFRNRETPWRHMPVEFVRRALAGDILGSGQHQVRRELWQRVPAVVREELQKLLTQGRWTSALPLAWSAPAEETRSLVGMLRKELHQQDVPRQEVIHWLHQRITERVPEWQEAWGLLVQLSPGTRGEPGSGDRTGGPDPE
jgi:hypothetical protein